MMVVIIGDGSRNPIHADHRFLTDTHDSVIDFLKGCILVDYDVLCEQCGCKKLFAITHTLKNRLDIAGKAVKHRVRIALHFRKLL